MTDNTRRGVLVTGASRGLGRATAIAFAAAGDRVAVHYANSRAAAEETLALLAGEGHAVVAGDLADAEEARGIVDRAVAGVGPLDVLVNNAADGPSLDNQHPIDEGDWEAWRSAWEGMTRTNLLGPAHLTWAFARHLIEREAPGAIVNVGSRGAFRGEPDYPAYGATKAALHALGQSIAPRLAPHGISVASVAPGFIATERQAAKLDGPTGDALRAQSPFGRVGTPEEIAEAIVYLASPGAVWASGAILDLNGASHFRM
ncbi:SDR family oxidoreductase [Salinibacterium sp. dk2585]|uniref:SDR family NAD(P)-dependent oxidoreductase n=1 Tax=unclassified Salinibacterium TaxID=2632331 RepID=UPI0011C249A4|nr:MULTISPECIES: SDR family oxidoreductase [unclassified Salinibacterium]QEE61046.1 SDR family oxidoreductase [Salinibacterium sp. dk2585]TXK52988.1 SDR family oxidoreductase [Salinibacterium sp. dk5596]